MDAYISYSLMNMTMYPGENNNNRGSIVTLRNEIVCFVFLKLPQMESPIDLINTRKKQKNISE